VVPYDFIKVDNLNSKRYKIKIQCTIFSLKTLDGQGNTTTVRLCSVAIAVKDQRRAQPCLATAGYSLAQQFSL
jgi:hypothetical protein